MTTSGWTRIPGDVPAEIARTSGVRQLIEEGRRHLRATRIVNTGKQDQRHDEMLVQF